MEDCINVDETCRLCLNGEGIISVFDEENSKRSVTPENIFDCVSVKITKEDVLPKGICETCLSSVRNWCSFKSTCDRTQETLNGWLNCNRLKPDFKEELNTPSEDRIPNAAVENCKVNEKSDVLIKPSGDSNIGHGANEKVLETTNDPTQDEVASPKPTDKENGQSENKLHHPTDVEESQCVNRTEVGNSTPLEHVNNKLNELSEESHLETGSSTKVSQEDLETQEQITETVFGQDAMETEVNENSSQKIAVNETLSSQSDKSLNGDAPKDTSENAASENLQNTLSSVSAPIDAMNIDESVQPDKEDGDSLGELVPLLGEQKEQPMEVDLSDVNPDPTDTSKQNVNERLNSAVGNEDASSNAQKENEAPQNGPSPDSDKENSIPNSAMTSSENSTSVSPVTTPTEGATSNSATTSSENSVRLDNPKGKQLKGSGLDERSNDGEPQLSFPELRIESISSLMLDTSEFFPKTSENSSTAEKEVETITISDPDENVDENSEKTATTGDSESPPPKEQNIEPTSNSEQCPADNQATVEKPESCTGESSTTEVQKTDLVLQENRENTKVVNESISNSEENRTNLESVQGNKTDSEVAKDSTENGEAAPELRASEAVVLESQAERDLTADEPEQEQLFSQADVANIKQEPIDPPEQSEASSISETSNIYPIRVKSEFSSIDYDDDVTNDYEPSSSNSELNKCDVCNRRYSSLSNYLKHLQTKVHLFNASLGPMDGSMQSSNDSMVNSYSSDTSMNSYPGDSPMLRLRLSEGMPTSPMKFPMQEQQSRQAKPRIAMPRQVTPKPAHPHSLSKLPKQRERCRLCNIAFTYISEMRRHLESKRHKENEILMQHNEEAMRENELLIRDTERIYREKERYLKERAVQLKREEASHPPPAPAAPAPPAIEVPKSRLPFQCPIENCNFSCLKGIRLLAHMRTHGIGGQDRPTPPPQQTPIQAMMDQRLENTMAKPKLSVRQQEMLKKELEKRKLNSFIEQNMVAEEVPYAEYQCQACKKAFLRESGLKKHSYYCSALRAEQHGMAAEEMIEEVEDVEEEEVEDEEEEEVMKMPTDTSDLTNLKKMHCPICNLTFAARSVYVSHVQIYHKGSALESGLYRPKKTIISSNKLRVNSRKGHSYVCNHCGKKFNLLSSLNFHLKMHSTKHICKICKKGYDSRRAFMDHCRLHFLPPGSKQTLCHKCFRVFKTRAEFFYHRKHDMCTIKMKIYSCNICQHSFKDPSALEEHKVRFHNDGMDIYDDEMDQSAENHEAMLQDYLTMKQQNFEAQLQNRPGPSSKFNSNVNPPVNTNQTSSGQQGQSNTILYCDVCDRDYATLSSLKKHIWKYHQAKHLLNRRIEAIKRSNMLQSRQWKCKHCKRACTSRRMLVLHLKKCKYNALDLEEGMCLQCGKWCESGKSRICRFCLPDLTKAPRVLKDTPEFPLNLKQEFQTMSKQEVNPPLPRMQNHELQRALAAKATIPMLPGNIRLMKCPVGNKYFRSELLMIKHYSQCDGTCENRCSHCRKLLNSPKEYRAHLLTSKCYGSNRNRTPKYARPPYATPMQINPSLNEADKNSETAPAIKHERPFSNTNTPIEIPSDGSAVDKSFSEENSISDMDRLPTDPVNKELEEKCMKMGRVCTLCNKVITMARGIYRHVYGCFKFYMLTQDSISCKKCNRTFSKVLTMKENTTAIRQHVLDCYYIPYYPGEGLTEDGRPTEIPPPHLCYVCSFGFTTNDSLRRHILDHRTRKDEVNNTVLLLEEELLSDKIVNGERPLSYHIEIRPEITEAVSTKPIRRRNVLNFKVIGSQGGQSRSIIRKKLLECEKCFRKFTNRNKYLRHKKVHGIVTESVFHEVSENYLDFIADTRQETEMTPAND